LLSRLSRSPVTVVIVFSVVPIIITLLTWRRIITLRRRDVPIMMWRPTLLFVLLLLDGERTGNTRANQQRSG